MPPLASALCAISGAPTIQQGRNSLGLGAKPTAAEAKGSGGIATNGFLQISPKKHSFQLTLLSKEDIPVPAVSAVTIIVSDNTKIF